MDIERPTKFDSIYIKGVLAIMESSVQIHCIYSVYLSKFKCKQLMNFMCGKFDTVCYLSNLFVI